jgi:hypothetical protein
MKIITVNSQRIKDGFRRIKSVFSKDTHESYQLGPFGDDSCPPKGIKGLKFKTDNESVHAILGYFNKSNQAQAGEKRLYAVDAQGDICGYIWIKADGTIEFNGSSDNIVGYTDLSSALGSFKNEINAELKKIQASFVAVGGAYERSAVSVDISDAKKDNLKIE